MKTISSKILLALALTMAGCSLPAFATVALNGNASGSDLPSQGTHSGEFLSTDGNAAFWTSVGGGGGTPGGSSTQIQYNNAGSFGGISGFTFNGTSVNSGSQPSLSGTAAPLQTWSASNTNGFVVGNTAGGATGSVVIKPQATYGEIIGARSDLAGSTELRIATSGTVKLGNANLLWPNSDGTSGQVIQTNGSGTLSFVSPSSGTPAGSTGAIQFNNAGAFGADSTNFFWDNTNKRLGLGTATPASPIEISTTTLAAIKVTNTNAGSAAQLQFFDNGVETLLSAAGGGEGSMGTQSAHPFQIISSGTNRITIGTGGNVGVGVADESGTIFKIKGAADARVKIDTTGDNYPYEVFAVNGTSKWEYGVTPARDPLGIGYFYFSNSPGSGTTGGKMIFDPNGKVAFSDTGVTPSAPFQVNNSSTGNIQIASFLLPSQTNGTFNSFLIGKAASTNNSATWSFYPMATAADSYAQMGIFGLSNTLVVTGQDRVGIGTNAPVSPLDVRKAVPPGNGELVHFESSTGGSLGLYQSWVLGSTQMYAGVETGETEGFMGTTGSKPFVLRTALTDRLTVSSAGKVGIGLTPSDFFDVLAPSGTVAHFKTSSGGANLNLEAATGQIVQMGAQSGTSKIGTSTSDSFFLCSNNVNRVEIDTSANLKLAGTTSGQFGQRAAATTTSYNVVWPSAQGAASTFLQNNGSGTLSWVASSGANTALSNLASVAINTDLIWASGTAAIIQTKAEAGSSSITVTSGNTGGATPSGNTTITTGTVTNSSSGALSAVSGTSSNGSGNWTGGSGTAGNGDQSGNVVLGSGNISDGGSTGNATLKTGNSLGGGQHSGDILLTIGTADGTRGTIKLTGNMNPTADATYSMGTDTLRFDTISTVNIYSNDVLTRDKASGNTDALALRTGAAASGNSGDVSIGGGSASGTRGQIMLFGHTVWDTSGGTPSLSSCGTSPSVTGVDSIGRVTVGTAGTACTLTFSRAWNVAPICTVRNQTTGTMVGTLTESTTTLVVSAGVVAGDVFSYKCEGYN